MFTGIIEAVGTIRQLDARGSDYRIEIDSGKLDLGDVKLGDSIASNGVCLTVVALTDGGFAADVSGETVACTGFGSYQRGQKINLEKAVTPTTRLGGHMVSGHVDGVGTISELIPNGRSCDYWVKAPASLMRYIAEKGSITVDGISLTVNGLKEDSFRLTIVPHTTGETTIGQFQPGTRVNLEVDLVARYLERLMTAGTAVATASSAAEKDRQTMELLGRSGFLK